MVTSLPKQIRMRPGPCQKQLGLADPIDQHPVWLDMQVAVAEPVALERMVTMVRLQRRAFYQLQDHGFQLGHVPAALVRPLHILLEGG